MGKRADSSWDDPDYEGVFPAGDLELFEEIGEYLLAESDIGDIKKDPAYPLASDIALVIAGYHEKSKKDPEIESFILDSLAGEESESRLQDEIDRIKQEIDRNNLTGISSDWIKEWQEERDKRTGRDPGSEEIREFVTGSFSEEESIPGEGRERKKLTVSNRSLIIRYSLIAAAAITGAIFLLKPLLPAGDTQQLFTKYYEPFKAVSAVTRGAGSGDNPVFNKAIENYRAGNYPAAETGFSEAMQNGSISSAAQFFLGITEIELENPGKAIEMLGGVASRQDEYSKEAIWYLGLAYIRSGNKTKAIECFGLLARSPGFYSKRSEKILRRLR